MVQADNRRRWSKMVGSLVAAFGAMGVESAGWSRGRPGKDKGM